jgi:predicted secreted protein
MTRRFWAPAITSAMVFSCWGVAGATPALAQPQAACPRAQSPSETITTTVGQQIVFGLESNRTTGYSWQLAQPPDAGVAGLIRSEYVAPAASLPGAGGEECWTFQAVGVGTTTMTLHYLRPFESGVPPARTQTVTVVVQPSAGATTPSQLPRTGGFATYLGPGGLVLGTVLLAVGVWCRRRAR